MPDDSEPSRARPRPAISVVLPTTEGWSHVESCVENLAQQAAAVEGEIIVASGAGPRPADLPERVRYIDASGESVFALRARAIEASRGEIIAITEDHCEVPSDWCARLIAAHAARPEALGVAGAVDNGSRQRAVDWANFFMTFGAYAPPLAPQSDRAMPIANASYKRAALEGAQAPLPTGWLEFDLAGRMLHAGQIAFDDSIVVFHIQSPGLVGTLRSHFHNGRSTTGLLAHTLAKAERRARLRRTLRLPWVLLRQGVHHIWPKRAYRRSFVLSFPMLCAICVSHALGEATGLVRGPGSSPLQLD